MEGCCSFIIELWKLEKLTRSSFMEFGRKSQKSAISRTISASKFCRGDHLNSQIDVNALKPLDRNNSHGAAPSEVVNQLSEELKMVRVLLEMAEQEKDRALDELREMKMEKEISRQHDSRLVEKDMLIDGLEVELSIFKASRSIIAESLSESKRRIKELEMELEKLRVCQNNTEPGNPKLEDAFRVEKFENLDNCEMSSLKSELKLAFEEKVKTKWDMDDLASALNEAKMEAYNATEKLELKEMELEKVKQVAEQNAKLLIESKGEIEHYKNTVERLTEVDESLSAWNEREVGFVKCVGEAEDEKNRIQHENIQLVESLKSANATVDMFREENLKLKAILKQSKGIAEIEHSLQLNLTHSEHDEGFNFLSRENRKLSVKELNRPLIVASMKDPKNDSRKQGVKTKSMKTMFDDSQKGKIQKNRLSFDLSELKKANANEHEIPLTGSIFDNADTPTKHTRRVSFSFPNDKTGADSEESDSIKDSDFDDSGNSWIWKRRAFLQSFEDLIKGRSVEKEKI